MDINILEVGKETEKQLDKGGKELDRVKRCVQGFPGGSVVQNLPSNTGDTGLMPGLGRPHLPRGT